MKLGGVWAALGLALVAGSAHAGDDGVLKSYAYHQPLKVIPGAALQRAPLSAEVLVRLQSDDYADVRVFNAQGQALPMALLPPASTPAIKQQVDLKLMPILGAPGALAVTGVSLVVDGAGQARLARVEGVPQKGATTLLAVLFDVRGVKDAATSLALTADLPEQQPVTFRLEASSDLAQWEPVAETVVYRSPGEAKAINLPIDRLSVSGRYLRVTWESATKLLSPVVIRGASLSTEKAASLAVARAEIRGAWLANAYELGFGLPFSTPITGLQLTPAGQSAIIPVQVFGRTDAEQAWADLASGTAFSLQGPGATKTSQAIRLSSGFPFIKVEADKRTAGFTSLPRIQVQMEPREIAFLVSGSPPYTLAAGLKGAKAVYLPLDSLMAAAPGQKATDLPAIDIAPSIPVVESVNDGAGVFTMKSAILWGVLLTATAILGFIAWLAAKKPAQA